jgi:flavin-dependent dehydrogenase
VIASAKRDVIVVGGGPGGSTCATRLAKAGLSVLVVEREKFPRFKIGESLLPFNFDVFDRIGLDRAFFEKQGFVKKKRAEFLDARTGDEKTFDFSRGLDDQHPFSFQVERAPFDALLLEHSKRSGAEVRDGCAVLGAEPREDGVSVKLEGGAEVEARFLVDASGQATLLGRRGKEANPGLDRAAVFAQWFDVKKDPGLADGNIRVVVDGLGWFWLIPLADRLSVGAVVPPDEARGREKEDVLRERIERCPHVAALLATGERRVDVRAIASWSYSVKEIASDRHVCVGDALGFVDPIFSTGVHLACTAADKASDIIIAALREGRVPRRAEFAGFATHMDRAHEIVNRLVLAFYEGGLVRNIFFNQEPDEHIERGITSLLAGDFWNDANPFARMLLTGRRRRERPSIGS